LLEINKIYNMNCLEGLKLLDDNSVDSIVTDPPYELGFMGKKWDSTGIAYNVELWQEALRVLKPGGHLLAFGGTRTYHRMVCAIEDAGFEIRDQMQWIYGSGFPKSIDISKALDKRRCKVDITATEEAKLWEGWGTALKPANEPIVVARKPISEKTIAENVLKWGTGGINIDDCRVEYDMTDTNPATNPLYRKKNGYKTNYGIDSNPSAYTLKKQEGTMNINNQGRFPANVILDEEAGKLLDEQSGVTRSGKVKSDKGAYGGISTTGFLRGITTTQNQHGDSGGASRFFYCAKASKKERGEGNNHPTVKPLSLIKYLITLVTPPEGVCLDPFEGSGTHALACEELGFNYIGFELDKHYCDIATKRIENHTQQL